MNKKLRESSTPARKEQQDGRGSDLAQETWEGSQSTAGDGHLSLHFLLCREEVVTAAHRSRGRVGTAISSAEAPFPRAAQAMARRSGQLHLALLTNSPDIGHALSCVKDRGWVS